MPIVTGNSSSTSILYCVVPVGFSNRFTQLLYSSVTVPYAVRQIDSRIQEQKEILNLMEFFRLEQTMVLHSPQKINRTEVNGRIYATDENGEGLYLLVPANIARYEGEGALIDETFKIRKGLKKETIEKKIKERIDQLKPQS